MPNDEGGSVTRRHRRRGRRSDDPVRRRRLQGRHRDERLNVTVFGFDAGEELSEHQTARVAIVQVLKGRLRLTVDGQELDARPGFWLHMAPGTPHALVATEPTIMLLTLFGP